MDEKTKELIRQEGKLLVKEIVLNLITTSERILTILVTATDNKLDDQLIPLLTKLKAELFQVVERF